MFNLGPMEVLVIGVVALTVLGPTRLPEAMRQVGRGVGGMRRWTTQLNTEVQAAFVGGPDRPAAPPPVPAAFVADRPAAPPPVPAPAPAEPGGAA